MEELFRIKGSLNSGFVGQITYTVCLPYSCSEMDIAFSFSKQHYPSMDVVPIKKLLDYCEKEYGILMTAEKDLENLCLHDMKTEIHVMASLNDVFIGCIHKQLLERHMHFSPAELTDGCIMPETVEGVLKVTVLVFNVLMDDTPYELSVAVSGKEKEHV